MSGPNVHHFADFKILVGDLELRVSGTWFLEDRDDGPPATITHAGIDAGDGTILGIQVNTIPNIANHELAIGINIGGKLAELEPDRFDPDDRGDWQYHQDRDEQEARK